MPLVELVPSPWTDSDVVHKAKAILETTGQVPVVLMKEIPGYVNNRLQNAMFSEIWRLIRVGYQVIFSFRLNKCHHHRDYMYINLRKNYWYIDLHFTIYTYIKNLSRNS